ASETPHGASLQWIAGRNGHFRDTLSEGLPGAYTSRAGRRSVRRNPDKAVTFLDTRISVHPGSCRTEGAGCNAGSLALGEPRDDRMRREDAIPADNVPRRDPAPEWAARRPESRSRPSSSPA